MSEGNKVTKDYCYCYKNVFYLLSLILHIYVFTVLVCITFLVCISVVVVVLLGYMIS